MKKPSDGMETDGNGESESEDDEDMGIRNLWDQASDNRSTTDGEVTAHEGGSDNDDSGEEDWEVVLNEWYEMMERAERVLEGGNEGDAETGEIDGRLSPAARPRVVGVTVHFEDGDDTIVRRCTNMCEAPE